MPKEQYKYTIHTNHRVLPETFIASTLNEAINMWRGEETAFALVGPQLYHMAAVSVNNTVWGITWEEVHA